MKIILTEKTLFQTIVKCKYYFFHRHVKVFDNNLLANGIQIYNYTKYRLKISNFSCTQGLS